MAKSTDERRDLITKYVLSEEQVSVKELEEKFNVSDETIRKDLTFLESLGILVKTHGGAKALKEDLQLPIDVKLQENIQEKRLIARRTLDLIQDNTVVFLDAGSTTIQLAKLLVIKKNLTVITNSLVVANIISQTHNHVICSGGFIQDKGKAMLGFLANDAIERLHIDISIIGSDGFLGMRGPTTFTMEEVEIRKVVMRKAKCNIVIFDATKFTRTSMYQIDTFDHFDYVVTNRQKGIDYDVVKQAKHLIIVEGEGK